MNRAYSVLTVKSVEEEQRVIRGTATTPSPDRVGDVVEPMGVRFKNPLPLLHQHDSDRPVGTVTFDKPTKAGITFEATLPKIDEPGPLKDRVDTAWGEVKAGLVRAVSIGFRALEYAFMDTGGVHFQQTEVLELSLVTVPANADAKISTIKSIDAPLLAATGKEPKASDRPVRPGASGTSIINPKKGVPIMATKTIAEQISAFEATRQAKNARMEEIMSASAEKGETLDAEQEQEYDGLVDEVKAVDKHLVRLRAAEAVKVANAKAAVASTSEEGSASRGIATVQVKQNAPKGTVFTRVLGSKYLAYVHQMNPIEIAKARFADTPEVELILRAAVAAGNTTDTTWASPLVPLQNATSEFIEMLTPATIIGRIPGLNRVPFNIKVPRQTGDPTAYWIGEGSVKPVSAMAFDSVTLLFNKVAGIVPITEELMRFSTPAAEGIIRDRLIAAIAYLTDRDFLDPTKAEVVGVSPASVTNGVTPLVASGTTADAFRDDLGTLIATYLAANMSGAGLVLVMTSTQAMRLGLMRNTLGNREFPDIGINGGSIEGIPVITSENIVATGGSPTDGYPIVAINAPNVFLADDGGVNVDVSREASLQMDSAPDSPNTASTVLVSLWQRNMVAIKAERFITWKKSRDAAVQYIANAKYA